MVQINGDHMIRRRLCSAHAMNVKHLHGLMAECVMADRYIVCRRHATLHGQVVAGRKPLPRDEKNQRRGETSA
jgi:hypothetical protein